MSFCLFGQSETDISVTANEGQIAGLQVREVKRIGGARRSDSHCKVVLERYPSQHG